MKEKILLFIPCYNCEKQIVRVLNQLDSVIMEYLSEVIIINNKSTDNTEYMAETWLEENTNIPIKLLRNNENYGLGGSHKVAFQYAIEHEYDYIIVLHGDDQGNINDILHILRGESYKKYDCCLGARFMKGSNLTGYSSFRTFGNYIYNYLFSIGCRFRVKDLGSGLNLYCTKMLQSGFYVRYPDNLTFNYCMVMAIPYYHQTAMFFPISWREDDQISNVKLFTQAQKVIRMLLHFVIHRNKFMNEELRELPRKAYSAKEIASNHQ